MLAQLDLRREPKLTEHVRVVQIGDFDVTPCGGTHCLSAAQVGLVHISGHERYKGGTRVNFAAGPRARDELALQAGLLRSLGQGFSCGPAGVPQAVETLRQKLDETRDAQPYDLLTRLFPEELMRVFRLYAVEYHCPYDEGKVKDMLRGLGREEVEAILAERGEVVIRNEMCNHEYRFDARAIAELFQVH